jgi:excisionase family DNA binding protein
MKERAETTRPLEKDPLDQLYTTRYVAELFSVRIETVRVWIDSGKLEAVQINGYWRVPRASLVRFAQKNYGAS